MKHFRQAIISISLLILAAAVFAPSAEAQTVASDNFNNNINSTGISGWTSNNATATTPSGSTPVETYICGSSGCNSVKLVCTQTTEGVCIQGNGTIRRSFAVTQGAKYTISVKAGVFSGGGATPGQVQLVVTDSSQTQSINCSNSSCPVSGSGPLTYNLQVTDFVPNSSSVTVSLNGSMDLQGSCSAGACHDPYMDDFSITQTAAAVNISGWLYYVNASNTNTGPVTSGSITTCTTPSTAPIDPNGQFSFAIPSGSGFCIRAPDISGFTKLAVNNSPNNSYESRVAGTNPISYDFSYKSAATIPAVTTNSPTNVAATSATFNGNVTSDGGASVTARGFIFKPSSITNDCTVSNLTGCTQITTTSGTGIYSVSQTTGLSADTAYQVKAYATNSAGAGYGSWISFRTLTRPGSAPTVTTDLATNVEQATTTLNSTINPKGATTIAWFRYSTTDPSTCNDTFGTRVPSTLGTGNNKGSGTTDVTDSQNITGLTAGTTYYFCAIANNVAGTAYGLVHSFLAKPNVTLSASPTSITTGSSSTLTWNITGTATSCTVSNSGTPAITSGVWNGTLSGFDVTAGSHSRPITMTTSINGAGKTFNITCTNSGGDSSPASTTVIVNLPDLITQNLVYSGATTVGTAMTFSGNVRNQGNASTGSSFNARFCIDNTSCLTSTTGRVSDHTIATLAATTSSSTITSSAWTATLGSHTIYFCADAGTTAAGSITESDDGNNCTSTPFTVVAAGSACPTTEGYSCAGTSPGSNCSVQSTYTCSTGRCYFCFPPAAPIPTTPACIPLGYIDNGVTIPWSSTTNPGVTYVDIDTDQYFNNTGGDNVYYHSDGLGCSGTNCSITAPKDNVNNLFGRVPGPGTLSLNPATTYYVRTYNSTANFHSLVGNFSIQACAVATPTPTPTPSGGCPWIQTTGGDVHSNTGINTPCGP